MTEELTSDDGSATKGCLRMIDLKKVLEIVPLSESILLTMEGDGRFPRGRMISGNRKAWFEHEIEDWMLSRPMSRAGKRGVR